MLITTNFYSNLKIQKNIPLSIGFCIPKHGVLQSVPIHPCSQLEQNGSSREALQKPRPEQLFGHSAIEQSSPTQYEEHLHIPVSNIAIRMILRSPILHLLLIKDRTHFYLIPMTKSDKLSIFNT